MRLFKTKGFARFQRSERIADAALLELVARLERGLIGADLGERLFKERLAREGQGRRGGFRILLGWRPAERAVFLFGFAKRDTDNIGEDAVRE